MLTNSIRNKISAVKNVDELLSYFDEQFVYCAFVTLLGREPDREGMRYYLGRLRNGHAKATIIAQLVSSDEGREYNCHISGLGELLVKEKRTSHRLCVVIFRGFRKIWQYYRRRFEMGQVMRLQPVRSDMSPTTRQVFDKLTRAIAQKNKR